MSATEDTNLINILVENLETKATQDGMSVGTGKERISLPSDAPISVLWDKLDGSFQLLLPNPREDQGI